MSDPTAHVFEGVAAQTPVFVNSSLTAEQLRAQASLSGRIMTLDVTEIALQQLGQREAISALLGAVAARLSGLEREPVRVAIERELNDLGLARPVIERNQAVALHCYDTVRVMTIDAGLGQARAVTSLHTPRYEAPTRGTARISAAGNSVLRATGGWRTFRPVLRADECNGCWLCFAYCPEGVISMNRDDKPVVDYAHCKGCQICVHECPTQALTAEREEKGAVAWTAR